jgi:hypothetical protein
VGLVLDDHGHIGVPGLEILGGRQPDGPAVPGHLGQRRRRIQGDAPPGSGHLDRIAGPGDQLQRLPVGGVEPDQAGLSVQGPQPPVDQQPGHRGGGPSGREPDGDLFQLGQPAGRSRRRRPRPGGGVAGAGLSNDLAGDVGHRPAGAAGLAA